MQQAIKTVMGQIPTQNNQFSNAGFSPNVPFPFPPPPASSTATSPPPTVSQPVTVDVSASKVEESTATETKDSSEQNQQPKKYGTVYNFGFAFCIILEMVPFRYLEFVKY